MRTKLHMNSVAALVGFFGVEFAQQPRRICMNADLLTESSSSASWTIVFRLPKSVLRWIILSPYSWHLPLGTLHYCLPCMRMFSLDPPTRN
ncbi:hypothetical protein C8Q79DRAFT_756964 [Trametes meyenii]|nr:hypothetical protein C8Q79DRAFT_756964 [Trametes meyenii]